MGLYKIQTMFKAISFSLDPLRNSDLHKSIQKQHAALREKLKESLPDQAQRSGRQLVFENEGEFTLGRRSGAHEVPANPSSMTQADRPSTLHNVNVEGYDDPDQMLFEGELPVSKLKSFEAPEQEEAHLELPFTGRTAADENRMEERKQETQLQGFVTKVPASGARRATKGGGTSVDNTEEYNDLHRIHLLQTLQALEYLKTVEPPPVSSLASKRVFLPPFKGPQFSKTLIFDLDETLVHCVDDLEQENPQYVLPISFPGGETIEAGINVRPYALECLRSANEFYQVIVFTASHQSYADVVLDFLDPHRELIQYRLYRESCVQTEDGVYVKDLRIIANRDLKDLVIVDNAVYSFGF